MMFTLNNLDGIPDDKYIDKFIDITYNIIRQMLYKYDYERKGLIICLKTTL